MRIGLNLLHAQRSLGGVWNYVQSIVSMLQKYDEENEYFVYCNEESRELVCEKPRFHVFASKAGLNCRSLRVAYEQTFLYKISRQCGLDVMHWFANNSFFLPGIASVSTIYDLLPLRDPTSKSFLSGLYIRLMLKHVAKSAAVLAPISQVTADDLLKWYGPLSSRMRIISCPLSADFQPASGEKIAQFREKYGLPNKFWVFVSVFRKHKNHDRLFQAFSRLKNMTSERWPLVLRCDRDGSEQALDEMARRSGIENEVIWLPRLSGEEMPVLYSAATASIFPSLFEGAGLPLVEAMGCGCPVAASDIPATREFAGEAALLFDPQNVDAMAEAMAACQGQEDLRARHRARGLAVAQRFRPGAVFGELMAAYALAYSAGRRKAEALR